MLGRILDLFDLDDLLVLACLVRLLLRFVFVFAEVEILATGGTAWARSRSDRDWLLAISMAALGRRPFAVSRSIGLAAL